ncbi:hypothetical protein D9M70_529780 [compost metagenome]
MFDRLSRGDEAGVESRAPFELLDDLLALGDDPLDSLAGLSLRALAKDLEDLLQALDMALRFVSVLLERRFAVGQLRGARHLWQRFQYLPLRIVDVLKAVIEQRLERLLRHSKLLCHLVGTPPTAAEPKGSRRKQYFAGTSWNPFSAPCIDETRHARSGQRNTMAAGAFETSSRKENW